jgi:hypothetical protein
VTKIGADDVPALVTELQRDFYVDEQQVQAALKQSRSFNVIHYNSSFKFDIFPVTGDRYQQVQFARRLYQTSSMFTGEPIEFAVSSPEDIILSKLQCQGGEVSEQQWKDVLGVVSVQRSKLDFEYLREWAGYLGVSDLLEQVLAEGKP